MRRIFSSRDYDMIHDEYWIESVGSSLDEAGIKATDEQIKNIAADMKISSEMEDMAYGYDVASLNLQGSKDSEIARLKAKVIQEQEKRTCKNCKGSGIIIDQGPYHSSETDCYVCRGEGRI